MINIEIKAEDIARVEGMLKGIPGGAQRAMSAAMNRGLSKVRTASFKEVRKVYAPENAAMRANTSIRTKNASGGDMVGYIWFSGTKIPLYKFNVSPKAAGTGQVVRAGVMKGSMTAFADAFIAVMNSGHVGIFERTGAQGIQARLSRYRASKHTEKVEEKMGLSMAQMVGNNKVIDEVARQAQETIDKRLDAEINRILNGYGGR